MTDHTVKSFGEQLEALSALVAQMGGLAEAQFAAAIEAIASGGTFYSAEIAQRLIADKSTDNELTPRESQVLYKMAQGMNNKEMARDLDISVRGARCIVSSLTKLTPEETAALPKKVRP